MNRRHITFSCGSDTLVGSIDLAGAKTGLLIVTGGNELRCGPFGSHADLANKIATAGFPVLRYDRRGVGDSSGHNATFADSGDDIAAALHAFRAHVPTLRQVVAFGNCDAASALMLAGGAGFDALVLANPWTFEPEPEAEPLAPVTEPEPVMPPAAIRAHYLRRIFDLSAWKRLFSGKIEVGKLAGSLAAAVMPAPPPSTLAQQIATCLDEFEGSATILIAENDRTAQAFMSHWDKADPRLRKCPGAGHSFVEPKARIWLQGQILAALRSLG
ncbi:MAG: hydrolase 1, exosortase A system-associated [Novosphingobium sp.]|uniref:hydrolase 1, exosortase A system-associated n=1 Tax=Novosphingobium sp. TaxID=1874826 RepID=UPI0032B9891B